MNKMVLALLFPCLLSCKQNSTDMEARHSLRSGNDSGRLKRLKAAATLYLKEGHYELSKEYFLRTAALAEKLSDTGIRAVSLSNIARIYNEASEYDSALKYFSQANTMFRVTGDSLHLAQGLVNEGICHKNAGRYENAFRATMQAVNILEKSGAASDLASAYTNLGNILKDLHRLQQALHYHEKALTLSVKENDSIGMARAFNNIGNIFRDGKKYKNALSAYSEALTIKEKMTATRSLATTLDNMASLCIETKDYAQAEIYLRKALVIQETLADKDGMLITSNRLARLYLQTDQPDKALVIAMSVIKISNRSGLLKQRLETTSILYEISKRKGMCKEASVYADQIMQMKDDLFNTEMAGAISRMETEYGTRQANTQLSFSKKLQTAQLIRIRSQSWIIILLAGMLVLLAVIAGLLHQSNKFRKQAKERVELLMKELNHRVKNNLQMMSGIFTFQMSGTDDERIITVFASAQNRIKSVEVIHSLLYQSEYNGLISTLDFITALAGSIESAYRERSAGFMTDLDIDNIQLNINSAIPLGLIINELLTNSYKYGSGNTGRMLLSIRLRKEGIRCILTIRDNCSHWDIGSARSKATGTGLFLIETLVEQLEGRWEVNNDGNENIHTIYFPGK